MYTYEHSQVGICYRVYSPGGGIVETYKYNPLVSSSKENAWHRTVKHMNQMNKAWAREVRVA